MSLGMTIGIIFAVVLIVILLFLAYYCYKNKHHYFGKYENGLPVYNTFSTGPTRTSASAKIPDQNLEFYRNKIPSRPHGDYIENILTTWRGKYDLLERNHSFIQWLFPNRKPGINTEATVLTDKEAMAIRGTPVLKDRVFRAFTLMLDFYGMRFVNNQFQLAPNHEERLQELNRWGNHNFLRISRILLGLKEFGYSKLMLPWLKFLADLIYDTQYLDQAQTSFEQHWITTLDAEDSIQLHEYLKKY